MSKKATRTLFVFDHAELVIPTGKLNSKRKDSRFPDEGNLARVFIRYRNGGSNVECEDVGKNVELYFPVWIPEMACPKMAMEVKREEA